MTAAVDRLPAWEDLPRRGITDLSALWPAPEQDLTAGSLLLVTVQSPAAYKALCQSGALACGWDQVPVEVTAPYRWMAARVATKTPGFTEAPVWLWARIDHDTLTEEVAAALADTVGGVVLLTVVLPADEVVVSSHAAWHPVLNQTWCPAPGGDDTAYGRFLDEVEQLAGDPGWSFAGLPPRLQAKVTASWKWCLLAEDKALRGDAEEYEPGPVQAAAARVPVEAIVGAVRID